jgi:hypothetical protein
MRIIARKGIAMPSHVPKQTNDFILIYEALPGRFMVKVREELAARGIDGSAYDFLDRTMPDDVQDRILGVILDELEAESNFLTERCGHQFIDLDEGIAALEERGDAAHDRAQVEITLILASWSTRARKESLLIQAAVSAAL